MMDKQVLENPHDPFLESRAPATPFELIDDPAGWTRAELARPMRGGTI